jgi:threonine/homoserine/homoserine lactone efflux protein
MTMASTWAFLAVSFLVIATPGPDTALTVRNTLVGGRRGGAFTALGIAAGQSIWALGTSLGLVTLLLASEMVFEAVRWLGAAYLLYLGAASLWSAWRGRDARLGMPVTKVRLAPAVAFRQGLLSDLGNPKMAVFFSSMLPQFADDFASLALHGLLFGAMTLLWLAGYACLLSRAGDALRRGTIGRLIEAITGAALVALGLRLAGEQQ